MGGGCLVFADSGSSARVKQGCAFCILNKDPLRNDGSEYIHNEIYVKAFWKSSIGGDAFGNEGLV
jgi:hypothetical protein